MGELKELQINIFYDHPSTNYVPPWQPLVAGLCLHCGQGRGLGERRRERGSERRAPGLNFHLSNPGPAHWLRARGPPGAAAPGRTCLLNSLGVFPTGRVGGPGNGSRRGDNGAKLSGGTKGLRAQPRLERPLTRVRGPFRKMCSSD